MLSQRLKQALNARNMKPIELSEKTSIPKSAISQYMSGYAKPKNDRIYLICQALDISEAWLLGLGDNMERTPTFDTSNAELLAKISQDDIMLEFAKTYYALDETKRNELITFAKFLSAK